MENKITLELTKAEVLMLQEVTAVETCCYREWMSDVHKGLREKALQAYKKPTISREEYETRMQAARDKWKAMELGDYMADAEKDRIRFYYELPEDM